MRRQTQLMFNEISGFLYRLFRERSTLRWLIERELKDRYEKFDDINWWTYTKEELDSYYEIRYGSMNTPPAFYAWSVRYVYFLVDYDGLCWVSSVPRYCGKPQMSNVYTCSPVVNTFTVNGVDPHDLVH